MNPEALRRNNGVLFKKAKSIILSIDYRNITNESQETPESIEFMGLTEPVGLPDPRALAAYTAAKRESAGAPGE